MSICYKAPCDISFNLVFYIYSSEGPQPRILLYLPGYITADIDSWVRAAAYCYREKICLPTSNHETFNILNMIVYLK